MGKLYSEITPELSSWLAGQKLYFVATAPLSGSGLVNCSPKGMDSFRILGPTDVAYLDLTGSGVETIAHLRENGRIGIMFCAFTGPAKIVRLHGTGEAIMPGSPRFESLRGHFPDHPGTRSIIYVRLHRISDSCGDGVPIFEYVGDRDRITQWSLDKGPDGLAAYRRDHNRHSVDGLPGLDID